VSNGLGTYELKQSKFLHFLFQIIIILTSYEVLSKENTYAASNPNSSFSGVSSDTDFAAPANQQKLGDPLPNIKIMDETIFTEPWLAYQQLKSIDESLFSEDPENKLWWLVRKAQCEDLLYFYSEFNKTLQQAVDLATDSTPIELQARINHFQGLKLQRDGGYVKSRKYFSKAMELADKGGFSHLYVNAKLELAYTHSLSDLFETSLKDMQEAYVEAFALNDHFLIAMINEAYGAIYGYVRQNEKSLEYYEKALETYERLGYKAHIAEAIYGIASTYRYWKKYDLASEKFRLYQQKISYTPNTNITYFGSYGLGMTLAEQGECQQALDVIEQALKLEGLDDYDAELYKRKASCLIQLNQLVEAEEALNNAKKLFLKLSELLGTVWHLEVNKIEGTLEYAKGNYQDGYQLLESYYTKYTDVLIENSSYRVASIRAAMEIERQALEKALSSQRSKAELLEIKSQEQKSLQQSYFIIFLLTLLVIVIAVITYQYFHNKKVALLSITDALSGLYNRRYSFNYLDKLIQRTSITSSGLSIIVLDIDDFKHINDTYGHPSGDKVIEEVVKLSLQVLRGEDIMGRIGGEEFLCVLPRTDIKQSQIIAERMRESIYQHQFYSEAGEPLQVTMSFGIATLKADNQDAKVLYSQADKALYQAKKSGKNCVIVFE